MKTLETMTAITKARIAYYRAKRRHVRAVKKDKERWNMYQEGVKNGVLNGVSADEFMQKTLQERGDSLTEYIKAFDDLYDITSKTSIFSDPLYWVVMFGFGAFGYVLKIFFG